MTTKLECIDPILLVSDMNASLNYYERSLASKKPIGSRTTPPLLEFLRDGFGIYLSEDFEEHQKTWVWIGAENIERIYEE